ncbi:hypothetical protein [Actinomadura fibrosa]|uniref:Uncharacterized protein n=1 Tax=Actinomadura fibrosa TaxID=111802 RepID=A0ABW2XP36_9ACTN|nr:hypothetical protein [Actinomadura fibrosa]
MLKVAEDVQVADVEYRGGDIVSSTAFCKQSCGGRVEVIKNVGFFRELSHGDPDGPSLMACVSKGDVKKRNLLASYLEHGAVLAVTGRDVYDVLADDKTVSGRLALMTDGTWLWPADLSYYVRVYNVQLPLEFTEHAESLDWRSPSVSSGTLLSIEEQLSSGE